MKTLWPRIQTLLPIAAASIGLFGCATADDFDMNPGGQEQDLQVALYLYPPASSGIPEQVVPLANIQSNTYGVINLDPGITVTGALSVAAGAEDVTGSSSVSGQITATISGTTLSFEAQVDPKTGTFELTVPQGRYDIAVIPNDQALAIPPQYFTDVSISSRNQGVLNLPALDPGAPVTVHVTWADGTPLAGARIYTVDPETGQTSSTTLSEAENDSGTYHIQAASGEQTLWIGPSSSGEVPLCHREITTLTVVSGSTALAPVEYTYPSWHYVVAGQTVNSVGQPVSDVTVFATRQTKGQDGSYQAQTQTDVSGEFSLDLPEGTYEFLFRPASSAELSGAKLSGVMVGDGTEGWLGAVVLIDRVELSLTVRGPEGSPVADAAVTVQADPNDRSNPGTSTFTDDEGHCVLVLGVGSYYIAVDPPLETGLARQVAPITVTQDMTALEDIRLEGGFSSTLTFLSDDEPVSGLVLQAWVAQEDGTYSDSPVSLLATAISDDSGEATLVLPFP